MPVTERWRRALRIVFFLALSCRGSSAQTRPTTASPRLTVTPTTLWMDWIRGHPRYGPDFLVLITPCKRDNSPSCECTAEFRNTRSKEFADYVASFPHGKVPVVYEVRRDASGQVWGTRLSSVGNWSREKLAYPPDGPLGVSHEFKFSKAGERKSARYMIRETALG